MASRPLTLGNLLTEQSNPASAAIDALATEDMLAVINAEDSTIPGAVAAAIPEIAMVVDATAERLRAGGRLFYVGAGTSGRLGVLDAAECPPTFGVPPELVQGIIAGGEAALARATEASEDDAASGEREIRTRGVTSRDAVVGIAASGRTPWVLGAVRRAREIGAFTAGISCTPQSELSRAAEVGVELLTGPEVIAGSTRMKAGTATKLALNMISTGVMIRLGHVYGNLMVNVQPRNEKLRDRAARIVAEATGVSRERASELVELSGSVKTAIVMAARDVGCELARQMLDGAGGSVAAVLRK